MPDMGRKDLPELVAHLAYKVSKLEEENEILKDRIDSNANDIRTWAEEVEAMDYGMGELEGKLAHLDADLEQVDEKTEMALDDIVTLDERTQPILNVKYVESDVARKLRRELRREPRL